MDSETILGWARKRKFQIVDIKDADIVVVNTCAFIKEAKEESINMILDLVDLKKAKKIKKIIVAGCLSQRYGKDLLKEFKGVDAFMGRLAIDNNNFAESVKITPKHFAYVKISEGCINRCSY